jgi:hypothetical protein
MNPPLSSVHVAIAELGIRAVETLLHAIDRKNEHTRRHQRLETTLVIRRSCGFPYREGDRRLPNDDPPPASGGRRIEPSEVSAAPYDPREGRGT